MAEDDILAEAQLKDFPFLKQIREYVVSRSLRLEDFAGSRGPDCQGGL
jgi:hypothetical protein